ncbi:hypothetical protein CMU14_13285 [Elizabethkingia anophelis]|nr:hypothetical protein [Elizabethkingia anophelis]
MKNILAPEDIKFKLKKTMAFDEAHSVLMRNEEFGIQWEQHTKKKSEFEFGKPKNYYFIDGIEKEYTDLQELCNDWNEIKNFDDPNKEIVWVKVIKNKQYGNPQGDPETTK